MSPRLCLLMASCLIMAGTASAQTARVFEPRMEGELWERTHRVGQPIPPECLSPAQRENLEPPSCPAELDQLYFPLQAALWEHGTDYRVFVSDLGNHRVVAFDRHAMPVALPRPIGSGAPGSGPQDLSYPEGVAVDASGLVIVADAGNNRLQVFNQDGALQFSVTVDGLLTPTGLAVRAGVSVVDPSGPGAVAPVPAIAVLSAHSSELFVLDAKFQTLGVIGGYGDQPGELGYATGVAFDAAGRLVVADYENSRVQVFGSDLAPMPILVFGGFGADPENLLYPYSLTVDGRGRIVVSDTDNQRIAVFLPDYSVAPATAAFQFDLNANGGLNGYPRGVVEDSSGRLVVVDTTNDEIEVFQVPDLAVLDASLEPGTPLHAGDEVTMTFSVIVPPFHAAVSDVTPLVAIAGPVTQLSADPEPTPRLASDEAGVPQVVSYEYTFRATATNVDDPVPVTFSVSAIGAGFTIAPLKSVTTSVACEGCEQAPPVITAELVDDNGAPVPVPASGWFNAPVTVRLTAVDQGDVGPHGPRDPGGVLDLTFQFDGGPELSNFPGLNEVEGPTTGSDPLVADVRLTLDSPGSTMEFRATDVFGNQSAVQSHTVKIDQTAPSVILEFPAANAHGWWRGSPLAVNVRTFDGLSGVAPHAALIFAAEGANPAQTITVTDAAGNDTTLDSDDVLFGGQVVMLDSVAPVVTATPATAPNANGWYNAAVTVAFAADDDTSGVEARTVSDPVTIGTEGNAVAIAGSARDMAGNVGVGSAVVKIDRTAPVTSSNRAAGTYAGPLVINLSTEDQAGLSGVTRTFFSLAGAHNAAPQMLAGQITLLLAGATDLTFWSVDAAGNQEEPKTVRYTVDVSAPPPPTEACFVVDFREITYFKDQRVLTSSDPGIRARNGISGEFNPALWPFSTRSSVSMTRSRGTLFRIYGFTDKQVGKVVRNADNPSMTYVVKSDPNIKDGYFVDLGGPARVTICPSTLKTHLIDSTGDEGNLPYSKPIGSGLLNVPGLMITRNAQAIRIPDSVRAELAALGTPVNTERAQVGFIAVQLQGFGSNARFSEFVDVQVSFVGDSQVNRAQHYKVGFHTAANRSFASFAGCGYLDTSTADDAVRLHDVWGTNLVPGGYSSADLCGAREPAANQKVRANDAVPFNALQLLTSVNLEADTVRLFYGEIKPFRP